MDMDSLLVGSRQRWGTFGSLIVRASPPTPLSIPIHCPLMMWLAWKQSSLKSDQLCVILEAVTGNMGVIRPSQAFMDALQRLCDAHGTLLIFDEVMTGFRVARGGAQALMGVTPTSPASVRWSEGVYP